MKSLLSGLAVCAILGSAGVAAAQDQDGGEASPKLGIGVASSFFVTGLDFEYEVTDAIGIEALFGLDVVSPDMGDSTTAIQIGARALYNLFDLGARAKAQAFGGIGIVSVTNLDTLVGLEGGMKLVWMPVSHVGIHLDLGLAIGLNDQFGVDAMGNALSATTIDVGTGDLFGGAGWTFWW